MKTFRARLKGSTPLLHHRMTEDALFSLLGTKAKKKKVSVEKTPRELAQEHCYQNDDGSCYIPTGYISGAFAHVASDYHQKNSARKSYKAIAGGVFRPIGEKAPLHDKYGKVIKKWEVDIRKATNHKIGAVAVCRPRFDEWETTVDVQINEELLPPDLALQILNDAGQRAGIGSFRVCKGGYFGQFAVTHWDEIK